MWLFSNNWLKTRIHYYERIVELKWDIWFYFNAVDIVIFTVVSLFFIFGVIFYAMSNFNQYIDPFSTMKSIYVAISILFIAVLVGLYYWFMKKEGENNEKSKQIEHILLFSVCLLLINIMAYCFCNLQIENHMSQVYIANVEMYKNNMPLLKDFLTGFNDFFYKISFYIGGILPILIFGLSTYISTTWYIRLKKAEKITYQTDVLFDEEENVKM